MSSLLIYLVSCCFCLVNCCYCSVSLLLPRVFDIVLKFSDHYWQIIWLIIGHVHPFIHHLPLIRGRVAGTPRLHSPRTLPPALPGGSQGVPWPAKWQSHSSVSWVFLFISCWWGVPGTPPGEGIQGASNTDAWATSAGLLYVETPYL